MPYTVVICFRTSPQAKLALGKRAEKMGVTLAELCQATMLELETGTALKAQPAPVPAKVVPAPKAEPINLDLLNKLLEEISSDRFGTSEEFIRKWNKRYKELLANPNSPAHPIERPNARKRVTRKRPASAGKTATAKPTQTKKSTGTKAAKTTKTASPKAAKTTKPKSRKKPSNIVDAIVDALSF